MNYNKKLLVLFLFGFFFFRSINSVHSQTMDTYIDFTSGTERLKSFEKLKKMKDSSIFKDIVFENIGPILIGGRVSDIDANAENPNYFYAAYASGGVWRTENNGKSFVPLFDNEASLSIGDIAVDWKNNETIWVGTGEANSSRSSYAGTGIYKSSDKGKTWQHKGLENTNHIARVVLHPTNPDVVWVAAIGNLYSESEERGVFKTTNGGETWEKILFLDKTTGAIDLVINPKNPDILYAALWHRQTRTWNRIGSGKRSGIYKTTDGGGNWELISTKKNHFPQGEGIGRIGLAIYPKKPDILYAFLDNQTSVKKEISNFDKSNSLDIEDFKDMTKDKFLLISDKKIESFLRKYDFPTIHSSSEIKALISEDKLSVQDLYFYKIDSNLISDKEIIGIQIFKTSNAGGKWKLMNTKMPQKYEFFYSFGYYFGQIRVSYENPNEIYFGGLFLYKSKNGGKTLDIIKDRKIHLDVHSIWLNPNDEDYIIQGNDGGINISTNKGKSWILANSIPVTQFYTVNYDNKIPYNIYGGTQDNGTLFAPHTFSQEYQTIGGGDGMQIEIDTIDYKYLITGYQYGNYFQSSINTNGKNLSFLKPDKIETIHSIHEAKYRFGWQAPILLSPYEKNILYLGSNKLIKYNLETKQSKSISGDLTAGGKKGDTSFGTIFTIAISPIQENLIYTGSDDGLIFRRLNKTKSWVKISDKLPQNLKVTKIISSSHKKERVYSSLNGYSFDNSESFLFRSEHYGKDWKRIGKNLPLSPINSICEDPNFEEIIYVATDIGVFVSINQGETFYSLHNNLPNVAVHDIKINSKKKHLILGTHGRSIYIADVSKIYNFMNNSK